jgi:hypothetical protein
VCQVVVPSDVLDEAEAKWAPPDDPVFQLVPPDFEVYVTQCFEDLGKPQVTFGTFWDVYCQLRDLVDTAVPGDVVVTLGTTIRDDDDGVPVPFALDKLQEQNLEDEGGEDEGEGDEPLRVDFTHEEGRDELF